MPKCAREIDAELSSDAKKAYEQLKIAMASLCMMYCVPFQSLQDVVNQFSKDSGEDVHAVIRNPPCNTCRIAELLNLEHDPPGMHDFSTILEFFSA